MLHQNGTNSYPRHNSIFISYLIKKGNTTEIYDENGEKKEFTFDYSFWSHDGFDTKEDGLMVPNDDRYADQNHVYSLVTHISHLTIYSWESKFWTTPGKVTIVAFLLTVKLAVARATR